MGREGAEGKWGGREREGKWGGGSGRVSGEEGAGG